MHDPWELENRLYDQGYQAICGVDEAGAGPLAGPVYAAAVILPRGLTLPYLNDSKKVTPRRREILFDQIREQAIAYAIAWADEKEIDEINILNARMLAMDRAIKMLNPAADFALIDGNRNQGIELQNEMVVHGDARSAYSAAASILAKVSRDRFVAGELDERYPQYQFAKHKGYATKLHYEMLDKFGPCPEHRRSFLKKWEEKRI